MNKEKLYPQIIQAFRDKDHQYYFDKLNSRIVVLSKLAGQYEYGDFQACELKKIERNSDNFTKIYKLDSEDEFEWMDDFCAEQENSEELLEVLNSENPFEQFFAIIENNKELKSAWQEFMEAKLYKEAKKFICRAI